MKIEFDLSRASILDWIAEAKEISDGTFNHCLKMKIQDVSVNNDIWVVADIHEGVAKLYGRIKFIEGLNLNDYGRSYFDTSGDHDGCDTAYELSEREQELFLVGLCARLDAEDKLKNQQQQQVKK